MGLDHNTKSCARNKQQLFLVSVALCLAFLTFYQLLDYPKLDSDEGFFLLFAQTWSDHGFHGVIDSTSSQPLHYPSFGLSTGPGISLPVMVGFTIFGSSFCVARTICAFYIILLALVTYKIAKILYPEDLCHRVLLLLFVFSPVHFLYGRHFKGEVPGTVYCLLSYLFWTIPNSRSTRQASLAGLFAGFAVLTKAVFIFLVPAFIASFLVNRFSARRSISDNKDFYTLISVFLLTLAAWYAYVVVSQDAGILVSHIARFQDIFLNETFRRYSSGLTLKGPRILVLTMLIVASLSYITYLMISKRQFAELPLVVFCVLNIFYAYSGIETERRLVPTILISYLFISKAIADALAYCVRDARWKRMLLDYGSNVLLVLAFTFNLGLIHLMKSPLARQTVAYMEENIPQNAIVSYQITEHLAFLAKGMKTFPRAHIETPYRHIDIALSGSDYLVMNKGFYNFMLRRLGPDDIERLENFELLKSFSHKPVIGTEMDYQIYKRRDNSKDPGPGVP